MLRFLANPKDATAFQRIITLFANIGSATARKLYTLTQKEDITLLDACRRIDKLTNRSSTRAAAKRIAQGFDFDYRSHTSGECIEHLLKQTAYPNYLQSISRDVTEYQERSSNLDSFIADAIDATSDDPANIGSYLQNISLITSADEKSREECVTLMTFHAAKGLEFPIVFIVGMEERIIPHYLALEEHKDPTLVAEALEEERRICYVGMTRAKRHLHLTHCRKRKARKGSRFSYEYGQMSRFIREAKLL